MSTDKPIAIEAEPVIPYVQPDQAADCLKPIIEPYMQRMGFLPNALMIHMHRPEIAEIAWQLNNRVMRDPSSTLDVQLKRKCGALASALNGCRYCTAHSCHMLKRPKGADSEGWGFSDEDLIGLMNGSAAPANETEAACFEFVRVATKDPSNVPVALLERLKEHLSPPQIVELAFVVAFWKFYNTIHDSLHIPIEAALIDDGVYVDHA